MPDALETTRLALGRGCFQTRTLTGLSALAAKEKETARGGPNVALGRDRKRCSRHLRLHLGDDHKIQNCKRTSIRPTQYLTTIGLRAHDQLLFATLP